MLPRLIGVERSALVPISLGEAYERYYATPFNSGTLKAYGDRSALDAGTALGPASTEYLLSVMRRVETGGRRIKAGLPSGTGSRTRPAPSARASAMPGWWTSQARRTRRPSA